LVAADDDDRAGLINSQPVPVQQGDKQEKQHKRRDDAHMDKPPSAPLIVDGGRRRLLGSGRAAFHGFVLTGCIIPSWRGVCDWLRTVQGPLCDADGARQWSPGGGSQRSRIIAVARQIRGRRGSSGGGRLA